VLLTIMLEGFAKALKSPYPRAAPLEAKSLRAYSSPY